MSASLTDGMMYELRPVSDTSKNMAIGSSSHVNGAKAIIYSILDINDQKWLLSQVTGGWRITNVESGKRIVVWWPTSDAPWNVGQEIVQWEGGTENAVWTAVQTGSVTVDGVECPVVVFEVAAHTGYAMSVSDGIYYGSYLVKLAASDTSATTQQWICIPTLAHDSSLPAPASLTITGTKEKNAANSITFSGLKAQWTMPNGIAANSDVTYQVHTRYRKMAISGAWDAWTSWSTWATATTSRSGNTFTESSGHSISVNNTQKLAQLQFEVRAVRSGTSAGPVARETATCYIVPVLTLSGASWTPEGLTIAASSSYTSSSTYVSRGPTTVKVSSIKASGAELVKEPSSSVLMSDSDSIFIPQENLLGIPSSGVQLTVYYYVGTDTHGLFSTRKSGTATVSYNAGSPTVTVTDTAGYTKTVSVANSDDTKVWLLYDGKAYECENGVAVYPFGKAYELFASGTYGPSGSKAQFAWHQSFNAVSAGVHAWNWDGGSALLEIREGGPLTVEDSIEAVYESYDLFGRAYETVDFADTLHHKFTASGAVAVGITESVRGDFELIAGLHATYRSPRGDIVPVAIISVSREAHKDWTEINVSMIRESE